MKLTTALVIVGIVLLVGLVIPQGGITGAAITNPAISGYCRQTVDPYTGVGSFMCDSRTQVLSVSEGSVTGSPLFLRSGGSTYMFHNPQRRCSWVNCDLGMPTRSFTRLSYTPPTYSGLFSVSRWCARDPDRCNVIQQETGYINYNGPSPAGRYWRYHDNVIS